MADEESEPVVVEEPPIELPDEPVVVGVSGESGERSNKGVIYFGIITAIACLIIIFYVFFKKDKVNTGRYNSGPLLNSRTLSSNSGYGGAFNGTSYSTSI